MVCAGRDPKDHLVLTPCHGQHHLPLDQFGILGTMKSRLMTNFSFWEYPLIALPPEHLLVELTKADSNPISQPAKTNREHHTQYNQNQGGQSKLYM